MSEIAPSHGPVGKFEFWKKNLFDPWSATDAASQKHFIVLQEADKELKKIPGYIGMTVFGSLLRGYAVADSDIDTHLFFGDGADEHVMGRVVKLFQTLTKKYGVEMYHFDIKMLDETLVQHAPQSTAPYNVLQNLAYWTSRNTGNASVGAWREKFKSWAKDLDDKQRKQIKHHLSLKLLDADMFRFGEMQNRIEELQMLAPREVNELRKARLELWTKRIEEVYGL
jgi:predicted nucleotidyltransferase